MSDAMNKTPQKQKATTAQTVLIPNSIDRLAWQHKMPAKAFAAHLLQLAALAIDDALASNCETAIDTLGFAVTEHRYATTEYFSITGMIERIPIEMLSEYQAEANADGIPVQAVIRQYAEVNLDRQRLQ